MEPAPATLPAVLADPATATLPAVATDPATARLSAVAIEPATVSLSTPTAESDAESNATVMGLIISAGCCLSGVHPGTPSGEDAVGQR
nr:hypothetical protein [Mycobacterium simulans]